jgi:hypothetical protein
MCGGQHGIERQKPTPANAIGMATIASTIASRRAFRIVRRNLCVLCSIPVLAACMRRAALSLMPDSVKGFGAPRRLERLLRFVRDPEKKHDTRDVLNPPDVQEAIEENADHDDSGHVPARDRLRDVSA